MRPSLALTLSSRVTTQNLPRVSEYSSSAFMISRFSLPGFKNAMENRKYSHRSQHHYQYNSQFYYSRRRRRHHQYNHHHHHPHHHHHHHHHHNRDHHHRHRHHCHHHPHHHHHHHHCDHHFPKRDHYNRYPYFCSSNCTLIGKQKFYGEESRQYLQLILQSTRGTLAFVNFLVKKFLCFINCLPYVIQFLKAHRDFFKIWFLPHTVSHFIEGNK